ncbi:hypothetical protein ACFLVY_00305, partial [Chloroflexota bacterium]
SLINGSELQRKHQARDNLDVETKNDVNVLARYIELVYRRRAQSGADGNHNRLSQRDKRDQEYGNQNED